MTVDAAPTQRRDRSHILYISVLVAMALGIAVGFLFPKAGIALRPLGTGFVDLIRMMIAPVIFCTIVLGVGSIRKAAQVGKVGGLALAYFLIMSTVALAIGLVVGNILHPGAGLNLSDELAKTGQAQVSEEAEGAVDFVLGIIPDTLFSALTSQEVLQTLLVALLVGFAIQALGPKGEPAIRAIAVLQRVVSRSSR
jgi:aerobic C4-dicarboxylate transport protein